MSKFETIQGLLEGYASSNTDEEGMAGGVEEQKNQAKLNYWEALMAISQGETTRDIRGAFRIIKKAKHNKKS